MRLIKAQTTNLRSIKAKGVRYDINGQVVMESTDALLVPKGTTAERPTSPATGHLRYNTSTDEFEGYQNNHYLHLNGLKMLDNETAESIATFIGRYLYLDGLETLDNETAKQRTLEQQNERKHKRVDR